MNIAFDRSNGEGAKSLLARVKLVTELTRIRRDLMALEPGVKGLAQRLAFVRRVNEIRIELKAVPAKVSEQGPVGTLEVEPQDDAPQAPVTRRPTDQFYQYHEKRTKGQRQKANNAALDLLNQVNNGELSKGSLTDAQKEVLGGYTGNGGSLIGADGKKGSAYEYYTPKPIADGIWDAMVEMGFSGGKVLDPCAGVGIFGATAPANAAIDAVELDATSGGINALINDSESYSTTVSPFEAVAANTPDEIYDAVISNVPFGTVADRGGNQLQDPKYQKETLEAYFILRSLDKLKPGGLAAFVVPPRCVTGKGGAETKLRARASMKAEFLGAYRLPNSVFGAADADTITDVMFFRKYSRDAAEKIAELQEQDPGKLDEANVMWAPFLDGQYFKGEGRRFVLGEFVPKDPTKFRDVDRVKNPASIPDVAKMIRKLPKTRINWDLLDATETMPIIYNEGDTITQAGQTLELKDGEWVALKATDSDREAIALLSKCTDPYAAFDAGITYEQAQLLVTHMRKSSQSMDIPSWLAASISTLEKSGDEEARKVAWLPGLVGMAVAQVLDEVGRGSGTNFEEQYVKLSAAMKANAPTVRSLMGGLGGQFKRGLGELTGHYQRKTGFSGVWRGDVQAMPSIEVSAMGGFEGLLYQNKSNWVTLDQARSVLGAEFDPMASDDWCMSDDGLSVMRADDYYIGNYGEYLKKIDSQIAGTADGELKDKLTRQKLAAMGRVDKVDVSKISFNLFSPYVTIEQKAEFLRRFVHPGAVVTYNDKTSEPQIDFDIPGSNLTDNDKLIRRMSAYLKNGTVTLGGVKLGMSDEKAVKELRAMINKANEQFNGWARGNVAVLDKLKQQTEDPAKLRFSHVEDESPLSIPGMNPDLTLHGYQNAYVRSMSRDFSGINGFDVGLGKTFTALAAVQYVQSIGVKNKTMFVVPNSVLSNWRRESQNAYASIEDCLFVGLREDAKGGYSVSSSNYDEDLIRVMENRHSKIFLTMEAFERIRLREDTIADYEKFMRSADSSFAENENKKADERGKGKAKTILSILSDKSGSAPFLEDLGIDSIVIDEAHVFKNSAATVDFKGGKYLSLSPASKRGLDAQAKAWYVRGNSGRDDGMMLLTATPITNSPLEIYAMMSLASGHNRVNDMFAGTSGADGFMNAVCQIENEDDETIDGEVRAINVFKGLNNVEMLRGSLHQVATIKNAHDVGGQIKVPDSPEVPAQVTLPPVTVDKLKLYKLAYRYAADSIAEREPNRGDRQAFDDVQARFGETIELIGHPFNLINKMTMLIADPDLDSRVSRYIVGDEEKARELIDKWNSKKPSEDRPRPGPNCTEDEAVSKKARYDANGDPVGYTFKMPVKAWYEDGAIVIDSVNADVQDKLEVMLDKAGLDADVSVPPKLAAMLENVQREASSPRGIDDNGDRVAHAKQLIFCDLLGMHNKIRKLLAKRAGIPEASIAIITGQRNNSPEQIQDIQDGFNAPGEDNKYRVIIANEKAEVGINLQKGTQAIHHLTVGWTPDSLTQRNGRGVRQGNKTDSVTIYHYDADGTFDAAKRSLVNSKADWIGGLMSKETGGTLAISGGMSREQMEALIDAVGDGDAVTRLQEAMAAKDAEKRATTNRERQRINLDTILRQSDFLEQNKTASDWAATKFGALMTAMGQVQKTISRLGNPKMSETARVRAEALLAEQEARQNGLAAELSESALFQDGDYDSATQKYVARAGGESFSPQEVVKRFLSAAKRGENRPSDLVESVRKGRVGYSALVTTVATDSELYNEWESEVSMAASMMEQAVERYSLQSGEVGSLPDGVAIAFAEGKGTMIGDKPIITGCFIRAEDMPLMVVDAQMVAVYVDGSREAAARLSSVALAGDIIYPVQAEYVDCMKEAAANEDALERQGVIANQMTNACPGIAAYRETEVMAAYSARSYLLPSPYFPVAISAPSKPEDQPLRAMIHAEQSAIVRRWDFGKFIVSNSVEVIHGSEELDDKLIEYAKAKGVKAKIADFDSRFHLTNKLRNDLTAKEDDFRSALGGATERGDVRNIAADFMMKAVPWFDFEGDYDSYISRQFAAIRDEAFLRVRATLKDSGDGGDGDSQEPIEQVEAKPLFSAATIVFVGGSTREWKDKIKDYGKRHGNYRYWDRKAEAWRIQYQAWEKLITDFPRAEQDLQIRQKA